MASSSSIYRDPAALFDRMVRWFCINERDSRWIRRAFVLAAVLYLFFIGEAETGPINEYGHDIFVLLDGGWRILNGQVPYRDYYLSLGPLEYMITAFGMLLTHGSPQGIAIGNAAFGAVVGIWGWLLSRRRMAAIPALLVTAWLILTATLPTPFGSTPRIMSCAMIYNRHGYALLGIVLVECAFASERSLFRGGVSNGVALALMAFLKLNFFGVAVLMLLATAPLRREEMQRVWGFLLGLACTVTAFALYLRFAISAFLYDMLLTIQARGSRLRFSGVIGGTAGNPRAVTLAILTLVTVLLTAQRGLWTRNAVRIILLVAVVIAAGPLFAQTNAFDSGDGLITLWVIVLLGVLTPALHQSKEKVAIVAVILLSMGGVFAEFVMDAESVKALHRFQSASARAQGFSINSDGMGRLKFYDSMRENLPSHFDNGRFITGYVNDGLTLLRNSSTQDERVLTLGYINPFAYILRRKPALGGSPWLKEGENFPQTRPLDASMIFGNADLIMVANYQSSSQESDIALAAAYHSYLVQHFDLVASSQWWSLYRRKR
jgi:hypothetical protein